MRRITIPFLALGLLLAIPACGGGDDDGGGDGSQIDAADNGGTIDGGGGGGGIDAAGGAAVAIGTTCDPADADSCGSGQCLPLDGAANPWCSKACTMQGSTNDPACSEGYTGPGLPGCFVQVTGDITGDFCGIICDAPNNVCGNTTCDGTCPGDMTCGAPNGQNISFCE